MVSSKCWSANGQRLPVCEVAGFATDPATGLCSFGNFTRRMRQFTAHHPDCHSIHHSSHHSSSHRTTNRPMGTGGTSSHHSSSNSTNGSPCAHSSTTGGATSEAASGSKEVGLTDKHDKWTLIFGIAALALFLVNMCQFIQNLGLKNQLAASGHDLHMDDKSRPLLHD